MAYYSLPSSGGGGLGEALNLWNTFRNGGYMDQQKQEMVAKQQGIDANAIALQQQQQAFGDTQAARAGSAAATDALNNAQMPGSTPATNPDGSMQTQDPVSGPLGDIVPALNAVKAPVFQPQTPDTLKYYSQMTPPERQMATTFFKGVPDQMLPDTYDAWVSRQTNSLPPIKYPANYGDIFGASNRTPTNDAPIPDYSKPLLGDSGKPNYQPFGRRSAWVRSMTPDGKIQPKEVPAPLGPDQVAFLNQHPDAVTSHIDEIQQPEAQKYVDDRNARVKNFQEQVATNPAASQWFGTPTQHGMQQQQAKVMGLVEPHLLHDKSGTVMYGDDGRPLIDPKKPLTGSEATAIIYTMGGIDNPGLGVRDNEFERVFKGQGLTSRIQGEVAAKMGSGNEMSPALTGDIWNLVQTTGNTTKNLAYRSLAGIAGNAANEGIGLNRLVPDADARADFEGWQQQQVPIVKSVAEGVKTGRAFRYVDSNGVQQTVTPPPSGAKTVKGTGKPVSSNLPQIPDTGLMSFESRTPSYMQKPINRSFNFPNVRPAATGLLPEEKRRLLKFLLPQVQPNLAQTPGR